jgi:hypothetical protein
MIAIHLRDLGEPLIAAWRREFDGVEGVTVSKGDIFSAKPGAVGPNDPIDIKADAIVSPANSFGFMDGGIDAVYTYQFGAGLQERLQTSFSESTAESSRSEPPSSLRPSIGTFRGASARRPCAPRARWRTP